MISIVMRLPRRFDTGLRASTSGPRTSAKTKAHMFWRVFALRNDLEQIIPAIRRNIYTNHEPQLQLQSTSPQCIPLPPPCSTSSNPAPLLDTSPLALPTTSPSPTTKTGPQPPKAPLHLKSPKTKTQRIPSSPNPRVSPVISVPTPDSAAPSSSLISSFSSSLSFSP